jgi:hypothetical protein
MEVIVFMICMTIGVSHFVSCYFRDKAAQREHELMVTQHYDGEDTPSSVDDEPVMASRYSDSVNGERE